MIELMCNNKNCKLHKKKKIFEVDELSHAKCPECGSSNVMHVSSLPYKNISDKKKHKNLENTKKKISNFQASVKNRPSNNQVNKLDETNDKAKKRKKISKINDKRLESIDFSYRQKLKKFSSEIHKKKSKNNFDKFDEHLIKCGLGMNQANLELAELNELFDEFKKTKKQSKIRTKKTKKKIKN